MECLKNKEIELIYYELVSGQFMILPGCILPVAAQCIKSLLHLGDRPSNTNFLLGQRSEGAFGVQKVGFRTRKYPLVGVNVVTRTGS